MIAIRKAGPEDAAAIAGCLLLAMEEIVNGFTGCRNREVAFAFMQYFTEKQQNQYSYQNCWIADFNGTVAGAVNIYDGAQLERLRQPVVDYIRARFIPGFMPESETDAGEYYLDTIGVLPSYQGQGIGTGLLQFVIREYCSRGHKLGLLVAADNPDAKRLYLKLGFQTVGTKEVFGKQMAHLQVQGACK